MPLHVELGLAWLIPPTYFWESLLSLSGSDQTNHSNPWHVRLLGFAERPHEVPSISGPVETLVCARACWFFNNGNNTWNFKSPKLQNCLRQPSTASWNYATFGWCIGGSLVHAPIFETRFVLHMGVPMKNAAILDCIRSGQPSGCRKLSLWTYEANWYSPPSAAISSSRRLIVCKAAAILQQEKAAVKIQVPFKNHGFPQRRTRSFYERPCREEGLNEKPDASKKGGFWCLQTMLTPCIKFLHHASSLQCFRDVLVYYHRWAKRVEVKARQEKLWYLIKCFMNQQHQKFMVFHAISIHFIASHTISQHFIAFLPPANSVMLPFSRKLGGRCLQAWSDRGVPIQLGWGKDAAVGWGWDATGKWMTFKSCASCILDFLDGKKYRGWKDMVSPRLIHENSDCLHISYTDILYAWFLFQLQKCLFLIQSVKECQFANHFASFS